MTEGFRKISIKREGVVPDAPRVEEPEETAEMRKASTKVVKRVIKKKVSVIQNGKEIVKEIEETVDVPADEPVELVSGGETITEYSGPEPVVEEPDQDPEETVAEGSRMEVETIIPVEPTSTTPFQKSSEEPMNEDIEDSTSKSIGGPPTLAEEPQVVSLEVQLRFNMIVRYRSETKCKVRWYFKGQVIKDSSTYRVVHEKTINYNESRLEVTVSKHLTVLALLEQHACYELGLFSLPQQCTI